MSARPRAFLAALSVLVLISGAATPAYSSSGSIREMMAGADPVSVTADILILRPLGLITLVGGLVLFAVTLPIVAITRPHEIGKPWNQLVVKPVKWPWERSQPRRSTPYSFSNRSTSERSREPSSTIGPTPTAEPAASEPSAVMLDRSMEGTADSSPRLRPKN